jgi:hypothetical protein
MFDPKPKETNRGGRSTFSIPCRRSGCGVQEIVAETARKCVSEWKKHEALHNSRKRAKKGMERVKRHQEKKGKCDKCGKKPCRMLRACVADAVKEMPSTMDFDVTDPANFDPQLRNWD